MQEFQSEDQNILGVLQLERLCYDWEVRGVEPVEKQDEVLVELSSREEASENEKSSFELELLVHQVEVLQLENLVKNGVEVLHVALEGLSKLRLEPKIKEYSVEETKLLQLRWMLKNLVLLRSVLDQPVHDGGPCEHPTRVDVGGVNLKDIKRAVNNLSV